MSILTQALVAERYGLRLGVDKLAEVMGVTKGAIYNQLSAGSFPIPTYIDGGKRYADYRDIAKHLDECREAAITSHSSHGASSLA